MVLERHLKTANEYILFGRLLRVAIEENIKVMRIMSTDLVQTILNSEEPWCKYTRLGFNCQANKQIPEDVLTDTAYFSHALFHNEDIMTMTYYGAEKVTPNYNVMGVAKAALEASSTLPGAKAIRGYGQQGAGTLGGSLAATGAGAAGGAAAGLPLGMPGVVVGSIVGGILGKLGYDAFAGGTQSIKPEDVISFGTGTGSRQHFDQLREDIRERAVAMAYAYFQETGQKLNLNSAFRSAQEQAELAARGGQGRNPIAEPGNSLHQQGRALDFNRSEVDALERMGLLKEFVFNRLAGDPPHIYMQDGGIASGPKSGYQATLHGTEAVVPLPDGKTIPVTMPEMSSQVSMMSEQITRLDELIALMRNANGISNKILQAANN
jgi:hypothetical protein